MDTTIIDTMVACCDTVAAVTPLPVVIDPTEEPGSILDFLISNWGELLIAAMAFIKVVVNITPTEADNKVFGWVDSLINMIVADRKKA
jgi:hypothetical protein